MKIGKQGKNGYGKTASLYQTRERSNFKGTLSGRAIIKRKIKIKKQKVKMKLFFNSWCNYPEKRRGMGSWAKTNSAPDR